MLSDEKNLRRALKSNACFSFLSGSSLCLFPNYLTDLMGIRSEQVLMYVGIGLILFSATVFHAGLRKRVSLKQVWSIIVQDWVWVIASGVIIGIEAWGLSATGYGIIGLVALLVLCFGSLQYYYLKRFSV